MVISPQQIDEIVQVLVRECQPERVILFGSYANGTAREDSDLDLAIVKETPLPAHQRSREFHSALRANGRKLFFGLDILVYTPGEFQHGVNQPLSFVHEIQTTGKMLYAA